MQNGIQKARLSGNLMYDRPIRVSAIFRQRPKTNIRVETDSASDSSVLRHLPLLQAAIFT